MKELNRGERERVESVSRNSGRRMMMKISEVNEKIGRLEHLDFKNCSEYQ